MGGFFSWRFSFITGAFNTKKEKRGEVSPRIDVEMAKQMVRRLAPQAKKWNLRGLNARPSAGNSSLVTKTSRTANESYANAKQTLSH